MLELPLVWQSDLKKMIDDLRVAGEFRIDGLHGRERAPRPGCVLMRVDARRQ